MTPKTVANAAAKSRSRSRKFARMAEPTDTTAQELNVDAAAEQTAVEGSTLTSAAVTAKSTRTRRNKKPAVEPPIVDEREGAATATSTEMGQQDTPANELADPELGANTTSDAPGDDAANDSGEDPLSPISAPAASEPEQTSAQSETDKPKTKTTLVLALLQRETGASLPELVAATGWLPHTTRAVLTGLKKKGHAVTSEKIGDVRRYRVAPAQAGASE